MKTANLTLIAILFCAGLSVCQYLPAQCADCGSTAGSASGCADCGQGGWGWNSARAEQRRAQHEEAHALSKRIYDRNAAWPKPFECWDRTSYFNVWQNMYYSGLATQCTLTDAHFDPSTGDLNKLGQRKILTVMQNNAELQRGLLVASTRDLRTTERRLENVRNEVRQWYGEDVAMQVAVTNIIPRSANGARVEAINLGYGASIPAPVISTSSSSGSSSSSSGSSSSGSGN